MKLKKVILILIFFFHSLAYAETQFSSQSFSRLANSIEESLVSFVNKTVETLKYTTYKFGGSRADPLKGIYVLDCSGYVDYSLQEVNPEAYWSLVDASGADKPNSMHYYDFFKNLANNHEYWNKIEDVEELDAGDILVFRYKNRVGRANGHVMIVMDKPIQDDNVFLVRVADSASSRHSEDTRARHRSGIGIGTLLLQVDKKTKQPHAYAWKVDSRWNRNVNIAMGRPKYKTGAVG